MLHGALLIQKRLMKQPTESPFGKLKVGEITKLMKLILDSYPQTKYSPVDILPLMIVAVEYCS